MLITLRSLTCVLTIFVSFVSAQEAFSDPDRLLFKSDFTYTGAFRIPNTKLGDSLANYSKGVITIGQNGQSIYLTGHQKHSAIAEFKIPVPSLTNSVEDLPMAEVIQEFSSIVSNNKISRTNVPNTQNLNRINGMLFENGKLFVNMLEYYNANGKNTHTTLVVDNAKNISHSPIRGFFSIQGGPRVAGWYSPIPLKWQNSFGSNYIVGHASNYPINSRLSIGPSAALINLEDFDRENSGLTIPSKKILGFSLKNRLHSDLFNESLKNDVWTYKSQAWYGFIAPNSNTYVTLGSSGGHKSGVKYKLTRANGKKCAGYCAVDKKDYSNYIWLWDVRDMIKVYNGQLKPHEIKPYEWGEFRIPFDNQFQQNYTTLNDIGGATFDQTNNVLYISLRGVDKIRQYAYSPIIVSYRLKNL
jgi:hypothetical protein